MNVFFGVGGSADDGDYQIRPVSGSASTIKRRSMVRYLISGGTENEMVKSFELWRHMNDACY